MAATAQGWHPSRSARSTDECLILIHRLQEQRETRPGPASIALGQGPHQSLRPARSVGAKMEPHLAPLQERKLRTHSIFHSDVGRLTCLGADSSTRLCGTTFFWGCGAHSPTQFVDACAWLLPPPTPVTRYENALLKLSAIFPTHPCGLSARRPLENSAKNGAKLPNSRAVCSRRI